MSLTDVSIKDILNSLIVWHWQLSTVMLSGNHGCPLKKENWSQFKQMKEKNLSIKKKEPNLTDSRQISLSLHIYYGRHFFHLYMCMLHMCNPSQVAHHSRISTRAMHLKYENLENKAVYIPICKRIILWSLHHAEYLFFKSSILLIKW